MPTTRRTRPEPQAGMLFDIDVDASEAGVEIEEPEGLPPIKELLTGNNRDLARSGIYVFTVPAWAGRLADGRTYNTCPSAGVCAKMCYARNGSYNYSNVRSAHQAKLQWILDAPELFQARMLDELRSRRLSSRRRIPLADRIGPRLAALAGDFTVFVRIHDAGDFWSADYLAMWLRIMRRAPGHILFYCYTKEVTLFRAMVEPQAPPNFRWRYSTGGREDHLIDYDKDRHAEVFPTLEALEAAGYVDQSDSDLIAALDPAVKVGIPANNIPAYKRRQRNRTFTELQREADGALNDHRARARARATRSRPSTP